MTANDENNPLRPTAPLNAENERIEVFPEDRQLRVSLQDQADLLNLTHDAIFVRDIRGTIRYWNRGAEEMYGWSMAQALGRGIQDLVRTNSLVPIEQIEEEVMQHDRWEGELVRTRSDGSQLVVASRWSLQRDGYGTPVAILETNNDITDRKQAEEALRGALLERARRVAFREQVGIAVTYGDTWQGMLQACAEAMVRHLDASFARIWVLNGDSGELELYASAGMYTRLDGSHSRIPIGHLKVGLIAQERRPYLTNDVQNDPRVHDRDWARREGMISFAGYPLAVGDRLVGVLAMFSQQALVQDTLDTLGWVADTIAQGVERKRAEVALRKSERELRQIIQTIPAMVWTTGPDGSSAFVNERWTNYTGLSVEESAGSGWQVALHPEDRDRHAERWRASVATGQSFEDEARFRRAADGTSRWFLVRGVPLRDEQGKILKWYGILTDVEERRRAQEALRRSEVYLAEAQRLTKTGSWAWVPSSRGGLEGWHYWSEEMFRIFEFDPREGPPTSEMWWQRIQPEDRQRINEGIQKALRDKREYVNDYRIQCPDGGLKYIHSIGHPIFNDAGAIAEFVGTAVDLTEQKHREEALLRSEAYLAEGQRLTHTGSWAVNVATRQALHSSAEHTRLFGLDPEKGMPPFEEFLERVHPEDQEHVLETFQTLMRSGGDLDLLYRIAVPCGAVKYMHAIGHPVLKSGSPGEYVGITIDVTEHRRSEQERDRLRQLESDLAHTNRVSTMGELAATFAHEIKQPITAAVINAKTCLRWLQRDSVDVENACLTASNVIKNVERASEIIDRNRSLYRQGPPQREMVKLNDLICEITALLHDLAKRYSISIRTELDPALPTTTADRVQVQQVLMNLMLNGIEAMTDTSGELTVKSKPTSGRQLLISVSDTGIGLPADRPERVFDAFFTTKTQGTGMGLAVSRKIIDAHGGRLWASANTGPGATFSFELPIA